MIGFVDEKLRALIRIPVSATRLGTRVEIAAWIDTAFNGGLVIPRKLINELGLEKESSAEAVLADGSLVELATFACFLSGLVKPIKLKLSRTTVTILCLGQCY